MRNVWVASIVVLAAGCTGSQAWDKNRDGLVGACEGLNRIACELSPGCKGQSLACIAVCVDDGKGGCGSPCPDDFACVPKAQPRCEDLNPHQCSSDKRCVVSTAVCVAICLDDGSGGCKPCPATVCMPREPEPQPQPACGLIPIGVCPLVPACHVETQTACTASAGGTGHSEPGAPEAGCGGGCTSTQLCVNTVPVNCESIAVASCTANPSCEVEYGGVCEIACLPGSACPPCATPTARCVARHTPSCEELSVIECGSRPTCRVESYACPAVCEDDGKGGCKPCNVPAPHCMSSLDPEDSPATK